jgi:hypothetical protein
VDARVKPGHDTSYRHSLPVIDSVSH